MPQKLIDITGRRYGKYTVVSKVVGRKSYWNCKCDCGTERPVFAPDLKRGASTSCGCVPHVYTPAEIERAKITKEINLANKKKRQAAALLRQEIRLKEKQAKVDREAAAAAEAKIRATEPALKNVAPGFKVKSGMVERYGIPVPADTPMFAVELMCYRENALLLSRGARVGTPEDHFRKAFAMTWPKYEMSEWVEMMMHAFCNYKWNIVIGHERASKTFSYSHFAYLDYMADPLMTLTSMATVTFEGLKLRMWSDLMRAHETASMRNPFTIRNSTNELRMYATQSQGEAAMKYQIQGMAVSNSADAEGRIRGGHANRRRIFLDEAQNIAAPIFEAMINPMSAPDAKAVLLTNPVEKVSKFGEWCEPEGGWGSVMDTDLFWKTKRFADGIVLHFDGLQSPNVKAGKAIFTGLLTQENVDEVRKVHGEDSVQWWSLIRGWFPPDGMVSKIFPSSVLDMAMKDIVFDWRPMKCASLDPAFEADQCVLHLGDLAAPVFGDKRLAINCTESVHIKYSVAAGAEPKDYQLAHQVMDVCKARGVRPEHFIMDCTGGGRGVFAILQKEWSMDIHGLNYGGAATDRPLRGDNPAKCSDLFKYMVTEIWMRAAEFCRAGLIGGIKNLHENTAADLSSRRYELKPSSNGTLQVAETKVEVKKRLGRSPDDGDAFVQFGELLERLGTRPGMPHAAVESYKWKKPQAAAIKAAAIFNEAAEFSY